MVNGAVILVAETWESENTLIFLYAIAITTASIREKSIKSMHPMPDHALTPNETFGKLFNLPKKVTSLFYGDTEGQD